MRISKYVPMAFLVLGGLSAHSAETKLRLPSSTINCEQVAQDAAVKKASESLKNCKASNTPISHLSGGPLQTLYTVMVSCPEFAGDPSEYAFMVKIKIAFGTGNGKPVCFASEVDPLSAPAEALRK